MKDSVHFGLNKTGIDMSPVMSEKMMAGPQEFPPRIIDNSVDQVRFRQDYILDADEVGTTPLPGSVRGAITTGLQKITGQHPEVFLDKLGERLAYERTGVRAYDALITKCEALLPELDVEMLRTFRQEEAQHFGLLRDLIESVGADSTAMTPCADVAGVSSMGLLQVLTDPRTTVPQCVEAMLILEAGDNEGWDLLIYLARESGQEEVALQFINAKAQEDSHLAHMRSWLQKLVSKNEGVPLQ